MSSSMFVYLLIMFLYLYNHIDYHIKILYKAARKHYRVSSVVLSWRGYKMTKHLSIYHFIFKFKKPSSIT